MMEQIGGTKLKNAKLILRGIETNDLEDFNGFIDFRYAARGQANKQCLFCKKWLSEVIPNRHSNIKCSKLTKSKYCFPGYKSQKFCLLCFENFSIKKTDDLVEHYRSEHGERRFEAIGYSSDLFKNSLKNNLVMDEDLERITKKVIDFGLDSALLQAKESKLNELMGFENPGMQRLIDEYSQFINLDHFQEGFMGRILDGRLLIVG